MQARIASARVKTYDKLKNLSERDFFRLCTTKFKSRAEFDDFFKDLSVKSFLGTATDYYNFSDLVFSIREKLFPVTSTPSGIELQVVMPDFFLIEDELFGLDPTNFKTNPNFAAARYL